jgi:hypothetical protein
MLAVETIDVFKYVDVGGSFNALRELNPHE